MSEFFRGWRRKVGVCTLVVACVFAAGWIRSKSTHEVASFLISSQTQVFIESGDGIFEFGWFLGHHPEYFSTQPTMRWVQLEDNQPSREGWKSISWHSETAPKYDYPLIVIVAYWSIVVPLTALSAYLILSKPRESTPKKITEPNAMEGGAAS